jgi:hypothetical protein
MSVRFLSLVAIALAATACDAVAQNPAGKKPDATAELLAKLRKPVDLTAEQHTLNEFADYLGQKCGVTVLIDETAFKRQEVQNPGEQTVKLPQVRSISLLSVLPRILGPLDATYLVFKDHIEIVPIAYAAKETKNVVPKEHPVKETKNVAPSENDTPSQLAQPLVSIVFKEKPLNEAIAEIAEDYDLTVVMLPQSGDARTGFVSARLLNTPADKALEILAIQCDLRIVRKANAFMITTRDHSNDLFSEEMEREHAVAELAKFKAAPYMPPQPPAPQPQPQPTPNPPPPVKP